MTLRHRRDRLARSTRRASRSLQHRRANRAEPTSAVAFCSPPPGPGPGPFWPEHMVTIGGLSQGLPEPLASKGFRTPAGSVNGAGGMARDVLRWRAMDYLQFEIKRAHLQMVSFGRRVFASKRRKDGTVEEGIADMTPARFDLMYAVHGTPSRRLRGIMGGWIEQSKLRTKLGLSKPTVSKMLKRLEELGLVRREQLQDRRRKLVFLTEEGRRRIQSAFHIVFGKGVVRRKLQRMYGRSRRRAVVRFWILGIFESVRRVAKHFGDTSTLRYETPFPECDR